MNEGVKILIERMETNPDDFFDGKMDVRTGDYRRGKFTHIAEDIKHALEGGAVFTFLHVLTKEEVSALTAAFIELLRKRYTEKVMRDLLEEPEEKASAFTYRPAMTLGSNGNLGIGTTSGSNGTALAINNTATNTAAFKVTTTGTPTMQLGSQKLTEHDIRTLTEMIGKWKADE
jgi:hypothetical protein